MLAIVAHHFILRFPKLKSFIGRCWNKTPLTKVYKFPSDKKTTDAEPGNSIEGASEITSTEVNMDNQDPVNTNKPQPAVKPQDIVTSAELREPLLEC